MKTCLTLAFLGAVAATATIRVDAADCDMSAIQSKLFPNATEGLKKCASESGFDIWAITEFPTEEQAQKIMTSRTCVDYLNQINQRANQEIQCDIMIHETTKGLGSFIADVLTGQTGNQTESASGSEDIEIPDSSSSSSDSGSKDQSPLLEDSGSADAQVKTPKPSTTAPAATKSGAATTTLSVVAAGVVAVASFALQW